MLGLCTTWTLQVTSDTSDMSLLLAARCCTTSSTALWRGSVTGTSSSANSSMYWNTHTHRHKHLSNVTKCHLSCHHHFHCYSVNLIKNVCKKKIMCNFLCLCLTHTNTHHDSLASSHRLWSQSCQLHEVIPAEHQEARPSCQRGLVQVSQQEEGYNHHGNTCPCCQMPTALPDPFAHELPAVVW